MSIDELRLVNSSLPNQFVSGLLSSNLVLIIFEARLNRWLEKPRDPNPNPNNPNLTCYHVCYHHRAMQARGDTRCKKLVGTWERVATDRQRKPGLDVGNWLRRERCTPVYCTPGKRMGIQTQYRVVRLSGGRRLNQNGVGPTRAHQPEHVT